MTSDEVTKAGGPAFPVSIPGCGDNGWQGMTLRDYFAGQYMVEAMSRAECLKESEINDLFPDRDGGLRRETIAAALAYRVADAMLKRR